MFGGASVCPSVRPPVRPSVHLYTCMYVSLKIEDLFKKAPFQLWWNLVTTLFSTSCWHCPNLEMFGGVSLYFKHFYLCVLGVQFVAVHCDNLLFGAMAWLCVFWTQLVLSSWVQSSHHAPLFKHRRHLRSSPCAVCRPSARIWLKPNRDAIGKLKCPFLFALGK